MKNENKNVPHRPATPSFEETLALVKLHMNWPDLAGDPYWMHGLAVERRLPPDAPLEARLAALLHDMIEDVKDVTVDWLLARGFPIETVRMVELVSRPEGLTYMAWIRELAASGNRWAIEIKLADNRENQREDRIARMQPDDQIRMREMREKRYRRAECILVRGLIVLGVDRPDLRVDASASR